MQPLLLDSLDTGFVPDDPRPEARYHARTMGYPPTASQAVVNHVSVVAETEYHPERNCAILGPGTALRTVLLAAVGHGDEVILTDPTSRNLISAVEFAGATPILAPLTFRPGRSWKVDQGAFDAAISARTKAMLLQSPSVPTGAYFNDDNWKHITGLCVAHNLFLILDSSFDTVLYNGLALLHPASYPDMKERTVVVGSGSGVSRGLIQRFDYTVAPEHLIPNIRTHIWPELNRLVACQVTSYRLASAIYVTRPRRDMAVNMLRGLPVGIPAGGWCLLLRVSDFGLTAAMATERLRQKGVHVVPMDGCGVQGSQFVQIVFAREPVGRLILLRDRVGQALNILM